MSSEPDSIFYENMRRGITCFVLFFIFVLFVAVAAVVVFDVACFYYGVILLFFPG